MAAHAFAAVQPRDPIFESYGLVAAVLAGDIASAAAYALFSIETREEHSISVEYVSCVAHGRESGSHYALYPRESKLSKIVIKPGFKVINYPVPVLHDSGRHLQRPRAHEDEFQRIPPGLYAAHPANMEPL